MAQVRVPRSILPLAKYMEQDKEAKEDAFFPTYAHMIVFAAAVGFEHGEFDDDIEFCAQAPHPIPIETFKNLELYDFALVLTLARETTFDSLKDPEVVTKTLEGYSSAGFRHLAQMDVGRDLIGSLVHAVKQLRE
jgi:hypothetical protein